MYRTRDGLSEARRAAWRRWGRRHSNWFVYGHFAVRALPWACGVVVVAGVVYGVAWVWHHVPVVTVGWLCLLAALLVVGTWGAWEVFTVTAARRGLTTTRLLAGGATLALVFASGYALVLR
jgi:hypothetical protein